MMLNMPTDAAVKLKFIYEMVLKDKPLGFVTCLKWGTVCNADWRRNEVLLIETAQLPALKLSVSYLILNPHPSDQVNSYSPSMHSGKGRLKILLKKNKLVLFCDNKQHSEVLDNLHSDVTLTNYPKPSSVGWKAAT